MTTTVAPNLKPDHTESEERSTVDRDPAHTTREELDSHPFDPTQGRKIGSDPTTTPPRDARSAPTPTTTPPELAGTHAHRKL